MFAVRLRRSSLVCDKLLDDLDQLRLKVQLQALAAHFESAVEDIGQIKLNDVITFIRGLDVCFQKL